VSAAARQRLSSASEAVGTGAGSHGPGSAPGRPLSDAALRRVLSSLVALQVLDSDRRSAGCVSPDQGGRGTPDPDGRRVAQVDTGRVGAARVAGARLAAVREPHRTALLWVTEVAHVAWTPDALALHLAEHHAPVALRESAGVAASRLADAERALEGAELAVRVHSTGRGRSRLSPEALLAGGARAVLTTTRDSRAADAARAREALLAWGRTMLARAVEAWEGAGR
jgi:hypothetical protein